MKRLYALVFAGAVALGLPVTVATLAHASPAPRVPESSAPRASHDKPDRADKLASRAAHPSSDETADSASVDKADKSEGRPRSSGKPALHGLVNLNTCDSPTLELLPGIGPKKAERILAYRHAHPFKRVEDLGRVKGFGRKTVQRLRANLAVTGASTLGAEEGAQ